LPLTKEEEPTFAGNGVREGVLNTPGVIPLGTAKLAALRQARKSGRIQPDPCPVRAGSKAFLC
jgi:hypothetical protein